ncbi:MAG: hypothetical protein H7338_24740, partial [Candidatus Sericytochromatia bacterium]|nr:hypothetical protein [Candidatus Sericytochromatia bacterium]
MTKTFVSLILVILLIACQAVPPTAGGNSDATATVRVALQVAAAPFQTKAVVADIDHVTLKLAATAGGISLPDAVRVQPLFGANVDVAFPNVPNGAYKLTAEAFSSTDDSASITRGGANSSTNTASVGSGAVTYSSGTSFALAM